MSQQQLVDFKTTFVDLIDGAMDPGTHPNTGELRRFHAGELPEEGAERLREHLLYCRECVAYLRSPESFADRDPKSDFEIAAFWRGLRPSLEVTPPSRGVGHRSIEHQPGGHRPDGHRPLYALAASLAVGLLGLSLWTVLQSRAIATLSAPRPNVPIHDLRTADARGESVHKPTEIQADVGGLLLLTPTAAAEHPEYSLRILDGDGTRVRTIPGLVPDPREQTFSLNVLPGFLEPGDYTIELHGNGTNDEAALGTFPLKVISRPTH